MANKRHRRREQVTRSHSRIRSYGDLRKVFEFSQRELNFLLTLAAVTDPRLEPQIPLDKILAAQILSFVGLSQNMRDSEEMFYSRRLIGMLGMRTRRVVSDSRANEIYAAIKGMQLQKELLAPLVKSKLRLLKNKEDCMKEIRHVAIDLTTCSGMGVVDPVATGTDFALPLGAVVPCYYHVEEREDMTEAQKAECRARKSEFDKYRSPDALIKEYAKEKDQSREEKKQADSACRGKGFELPASKMALDYIIDTYGKNTFNMISADGKHLSYSEMKFACERGFHMQITVRKDDGRGLLLIEEFDDLVETQKKLKALDPRFSKGEGTDKKRGIRWQVQAFYVQRKEVDIRKLPCDVLVCKITQESIEGKPLPEDERESYVITTKVDSSHEGIYEIRKRHWEVEEQHKELEKEMNMKHIWSHDANVVWTLFVLMLIAKMITTLYFELVVVTIFGREELHKQKVGMLTLLLLLRKSWEQRRQI